MWLGAPRAEITNLLGALAQERHSTHKSKEGVCTVSLVPLEMQGECGCD